MCALFSPNILQPGTVKGLRQVTTAAHVLIDTASFSCCVVIKAPNCLALYFAAVVHDAIFARPPDTREKGCASVFLIMAASL